MTPIEMLRIAYKNSPHSFGISARRGWHGATLFYWHDYSSGVRGLLGTAPPGKVIVLGEALLEELQALRNETAKKPPQTSKIKDPLMKKATA
jgi:hypothetical protein